MMNTLVPQTPYTHIWNKYRPVILRLMVNAHDGPQQYRFSAHEFTRVSIKNRNSLAFILYLHRSEAINNIRTSLLAHSLLTILQDSNTAIRLSANSTFEFKLDQRFVMHVRKNEVVDSDGAATSGKTSLEIAV